MPQLTQCISCHKPINADTDSRRFSPSAGGVLYPNALVNTISGNSLKVVRFLQSASIEDRPRLKMGSALAHEVQEILRRYLR